MELLMDSFQYVLSQKTAKLKESGTASSARTYIYPLVHWLTWVWFLVPSNITSNITITNTVIMFLNIVTISRMWQRHKISKCCLKNGTDRLAQCMAAINIQFVKQALSEKCSKAKCNKTRYAYSLSSNQWSLHIFFHSNILPEYV